MPVAPPAAYAQAPAPAPPKPIPAGITPAANLKGANVPPNTTMPQHQYHPQAHKPPPNYTSFSQQQRSPQQQPVAPMAVAAGGAPLSLVPAGLDIDVRRVVPRLNLSREQLTRYVQQLCAERPDARAHMMAHIDNVVQQSHDERV
jgi:hypothetical protein